ncbi:carboxylesterase [Cellulomonas sp. PhB143]|uniref:alpha/beta hydrolase n=1 Tax=Cellulomonas sp. PhB143 TaxID=2485186 RepID=UPI000F49839A|nr:alpha/beta hydrolase [Cellulomonas sp. PhB143]ROS73597.1 alpha-beta hydrolase superfamily lysophospholipase [Cellulomonas sp. PhB143]
MTTLTENERNEIEDANRSGRPVIMLVHGLWLLSSSWDRWRARYEAAGYATVAPAWPDDPATVEEAREHPEAFAKKRVGQVTDHYLEAARTLSARPAVVGHSFGGLIAQKLAGEGVAAVTVAIDAAPYRGILPVPFSSLRSSSAVVAHPTNADRAVTLTIEQFMYGWANALDESEAAQLYEEFHVAAAGRPIFQDVAANLNPFTEIKVRTKAKDRGPMLLIAGQKDHTLPPSVIKAEYKKQRRNKAAVTEYVELPDRGHSLTIDHGWAEVADTALRFVQAHLPVTTQA